LDSKAGKVIGSRLRFGAERRVWALGLSFIIGGLFWKKKPRCAFRKKFGGGGRAVWETCGITLEIWCQLGICCRNEEKPQKNLIELASRRIFRMHAHWLLHRSWSKRKLAAVSTFAVALFLEAIDVIYIAFRFCCFGRVANCLLLFICIIYKIPIPALQRTLNVPTVETNLLVLCMEIIRIYCESHKKHVNTLCGQNADFLHATAYGPYAWLQCIINE
jgi:hypothetical protein